MFEAFFVKTDDLNASATKDASDESPHKSDRNRLWCEHGANRVVFVFSVSFSNELVSSQPEEIGCFFRMLGHCR